MSATATKITESKLPLNRLYSTLAQVEDAKPKYQKLNHQGRSREWPTIVNEFSRAFGIEIDVRDIKKAREIIWHNIEASRRTVILRSRHWDVGSVVNLGRRRGQILEVSRSGWVYVSFYDGQRPKAKILDPRELA